ncbi:MAG TPA: arginase family protein [Solirubrobacteraceae bacterium]|nr:arginase family protein [Solirubrobacteraceae bacterium]
MPAPDRLHLLTWPFHNGLRDVSMGSGAIRLATDDEFRAGIEAEGWRVTTEEIEAVDESDPEIVRVIELIRRLAGRVADTVHERAFPLVLAGNCNSALGTTAGIGPENLGVVWFDAHADFDDPDENESGFFDVMGLAMLTGRGWRALRHTIPGHAPIPERNVILAAVRDLEDYQRQRLNHSDLATIPGPIDPERFGRALAALKDRVERVYLHVDLDSLDRSEAQANRYAAAGGPSLVRLLECIRLTGERLKIAGAAITAYDPAFDPDGRTMGAARAVAHEVARGIRFQPTSGTG